MAGKLKELLKKYGKVGLGVHCSISGASITALYIAINNNVDVESMIKTVGLPSLSLPREKDSQRPNCHDSSIRNDQSANKERNPTADLVASSGGALALALLINKALFPVRVPITLALTRPVARFLAKRNIIKNDNVR